VTIENIEFESGYITVTYQTGGIPKRWSIADVLRAADIPALTYSQVAAITTLANLIVVLVRVLTDREILDEQFVDSLGLDYTLEQLTQVITAMGGDYTVPDLDDVSA